MSGQFCLWHGRKLAKSTFRVIFSPEHTVRVWITLAQGPSALSAGRILGAQVPLLPSNTLGLYSFLSKYIYLTLDNESAFSLQINKNTVLMLKEFITWVYSSRLWCFLWTLRILTPYVVYGSLHILQSHYAHLLFLSLSTTFHQECRKLPCWHGSVVQCWPKN